MEFADDLWLNKIVYTFSQEGNGNGTTEEYEELEVTVEGNGPIEEEGGYLVLRTKTGWSINDAKEFMRTLAVVENGISSEPKRDKAAPDKISLELNKEDLEYLCELLDLTIDNKQSEKILKQIKTITKDETGKTKEY